MSALATPFLQALSEAADAAAGAETAYRREAAERIKGLEQERAFAFRRLNVMRAVTQAVAGAESEEIAVAGGVAVIRAKLGWSSDSESQSAVLSRFASVARMVFEGLQPSDDALPPEIGKELTAFEAWYAETYATPFWSLFEQYMSETPVVDF